MAGSGKKTFTAGDVLTASDVNNYLMDQTVMVFGGTAARASAIPTPSEGMFAVTTDNDQVDYYDGSAWVPALPVGAWTSYTPTFTGFTLGNGTINVAKFCQIGKTVHLKLQVTLGSTSSVTSGITPSLPVNATIDNTTSASTCALIAGGVAATGMVALQSSTSARLFPLLASGTYVTNTNTSATIPGTWTTGNIFGFSMTYEAE
jgi:hypothetical protein